MVGHTHQHILKINLPVGVSMKTGQQTHNNISENGNIG